MKPGRLQNALKSFGRAPKCIKILWPGSKMYQNPSAGLQILENVGSGLPKITKIYENPKNVIFSSQNRRNFDHWDGKIDSLPIHQKKKKWFCSQVSSSGWHFWIAPVLEMRNQSSFGKLGENDRNMKNTWKSTKLRKSIKIDGNR